MPFICIILIIIIAILILKIVLMRHSVKEIREGFERCLSEDSNTGIDISTSDKEMRHLAAEINRQLNVLRKEHIRYKTGDEEVKNAITNISHDIRTPLTAIRGYLDLLLNEDMKADMNIKAVEYLEIINNRVDSLSELTAELFRYSTTLSGDSYKTREKIVLNGALEEAVAEYYAIFKNGGIEPKIALPEKSVVRYLNKQALSRIFSNIINNAVKYSDGDLKISLSEDGCIRFCNSASKLDEIEAGLLFNRFYTVEKGKNSTGLGLSIAKNLTEEMGGKINSEYQNGELSIIISFKGE